MRKIRSYILTVMMLLLGFTRVMAEDITVTVAPTQEILPPQLLLYLNDPGKFFNVMVTNNTNTEQNVYLVMQIEHVEPQSGLSISTPPKYQSPTPISLGAGETKRLVSMEMKKLFNHIPANAFSSTAQDLFSNYSDGSFGLLPEGLYEMYMTAYKWSNPKMPTPVVVSNPTGGNCFFRVSYKAQAPKFVSPSQFDENGIATVDARTATFMWDAPVLAMRPEIAFDYDYRLKIVEVNQEIHQDPADAIERNAAVYDKSHLTMTTAMLPMTVISSSFKTGKLYAAQVTAQQKSSSKDAMRYSMVENEGKSEYLLFRIATAETKVEDIKDDSNSDDKKGDDKKDDDKKGDKKDDKKDDGDDDDDLFIWMGNVEHKDEIDPSAMYSFRNPKITKPVFTASSARKEFTGIDLEVEWNKVWHLGGEGTQPDTLKFAYEVQLYNGGPVEDVSEVFEGEPIFTSEELEDLKYTIKWEDIEKAVSPNDHLVLRINPIVKKGESIAFSNDCNILDFAIVERLTKKYFQCANTVEISNLEPTTKTKEQLKGTYISIGEYQLKIDKIESGDATNGFKGKGRVKWEPLGMTMMLCVEFDGLKINTDDIAYEGLATTYPEDNDKGAGVVAELFSDWGIDNLISDTGIPYASAITGKATNALQGLADKYDFATYYNHYKTAQNVWDVLTGSEDSQIHLPLSLPEAMTSNIPSEMKIQIGTMKFAPTHATMDLIGEFAIPDNKVVDTEVLVFGAPRLCISPNRILPESGTIALLSDLNIKIKGDNEIKFKAPANVLEPTNGCYVAWKTDSDSDDTTLDMLGLDVDITLAKLLKVDDAGNVSDTEHPVLNFRTSISAWDDFLIDNAAFDSSFEVEDLPGWTFTAKGLTYDHSLYRNSENMNGDPFPAKYDKKKMQLVQDGYSDWQGLYFKEISVKMPKSFEFGENDDKRLKLALKNMFVDDSGFTFTLSADNILSASTGKLGGWAFTLDEIGINVIQDNFDGCFFKGKVGVPLLKNGKGEKSMIGYNCQILRHNVVYDDNSTDYQTAYVFKMQQMDEKMQLDMFLAKLNLLQKQSYFLVEAMPSDKIAEKGELETKVELVLGGTLRIAGSDWVEDKIKSKLKFDFSVPDIHFVGLRVANCEQWDSQLKEIKEMQEAARIENNKVENALLTMTEGKEFHNEAKTFYFHTGAWSLASLSKKLGPFEFTLTGYGVKTEADSGDPEAMNVGLGLAGKVALIQGIDISAGCGFTLKTKVKNLSDISNLSVSFDELVLDSCSVNTTFSGVTLKGDMHNITGEDEGFDASLLVKLPGDMFSLEMSGGFFKHKESEADEGYSWGYGLVSVKSSAAGIPIPPVQLNGIKGGIYFNCTVSGAEDSKPKAKKGSIGIVLGMSISVIGGDDIIGGDLTCTVIYDQEAKRLSQFMFKGEISAVSGLIKSDVTLLYENNDLTEYFQLNITVDASFDTGALQDACKQLNASFTELQQALPQGNLNALDAKNEGKEGAPANETAASDVKLNNQEQKTTASMGKASISLDLKITSKLNGKKLDKVKWHIYLGTPEDDKRCKFTILDFQSPVVKVTYGANAYVCVGNELPGDGQLPPIPEKIAKFLDGSTNGAVQSDGIGAANSARAQATANFGGSVSGGVMFGAQVYGNIAVDLGIIYGSLDALAGFDISLRKLKGAVCVNTNGHPGYKEWYGQGQLYAYLAAALGIRVDLGFYRKDIPLVNAAIGGVLEFGGPNPTYFNGKLRAKVNLLDGLVHFDKKFEFACGNSCQLFLGNPLDDFVLFDKCSIGDTIRANGWSTDNAISNVIRIAPFIDTNAQLDQHFRVLDKNELERIKKNYAGDASDLEMEAERTFVFKGYSDANSDYAAYARLYEYELKDSVKAVNMSKNSAAVMPDLKLQIESGGNFNTGAKNYQDWANEKCVMIPITGGNATHRILDLSRLNKNLRPDRLYRLEIIGRAFEIQRGKEVDPVTFDTIASKYYNKPWVQKQIYYFRTQTDKAFADTCDLHEYIAVAYPSNFNNLRDGIKDSDTDRYMTVHANDATSPTIALTRDISSTAYRKGYLWWRVLDPSDRSQIDAVENVWNVKNGMCNMEPQRSLKGIYSGKNYILSLDYVTYSEDKDGNIMSDTLNIGDLHMKVSDTNWRVGGKDKNGDIVNLPYEKPFCAARLVRYTDSNAGISEVGATDSYVAWNNFYSNVGDKRLLRFSDPFWYTSYLSNWAFIGGWSFDNKNIDLDVTTSQSLIVNGGAAGVYEGTLAFENNKHNIYNGVADIKKFFFYDRDQYVSGYGSWPIPSPASGEYDYLIGYDRRSYPFIPAAANDKDSLLTYVSAITEEISQRYDDVETLQKTLLDEATIINFDISGKADEVAKEYMAMHRGQFITVNSEETRLKTRSGGDYVNTESFLQLPYYQLVLAAVSGSQYATEMSLYKTFNNGVGWRELKNKHDRFAKDLCLNLCLELMRGEGTSVRVTGSNDAVLRFMSSGQTLTKPAHAYYDADNAKSLISDADFYVYRVNGYNFNTGQYEVRGDLLNGYAAKFINVRKPLTSSATAKSISSGDVSGNTTGVSIGTSTGMSDVEGAGNITDETKANADKISRALATLNTLDDNMAKCNEKAKKHEKNGKDVVDDLTKLFDTIMEKETDIYVTDNVKQKVNNLSNRDYVDYKMCSQDAVEYNDEAVTLGSTVNEALNAILNEVGRSSSVYISAESNVQSCKTVIASIAEKLTVMKSYDKSLESIVKEAQDGLAMMEKYIANMSKVKALVAESDTKRDYVYKNWDKEDLNPEFASNILGTTWTDLGLKANHERIRLGLYGGTRKTVIHVSISSAQSLNAQVTQQVASTLGRFDHSATNMANKAAQDADPDKKVYAEYSGAVELIKLYRDEKDASVKKEYAAEMRSIYTKAKEQYSAMFTCKTDYKANHTRIGVINKELLQYIMSGTKAYKKSTGNYDELAGILDKCDSYYTSAKSMLDSLETFDKESHYLGSQGMERFQENSGSGNNVIMQTGITRTNETSGQDNPDQKNVDRVLKSATSDGNDASSSTQQPTLQLSTQQPTLQLSPQQTSSQQTTQETLTRQPTQQTSSQQTTDIDWSKYMPSGLTKAQTRALNAAIESLTAEEKAKISKMTTTAIKNLLSAVVAGNNIHTLLKAIK